jgi:hypothetical protein
MVLVGCMDGEFAIEETSEILKSRLRSVCRHPSSTQPTIIRQLNDAIPLMQFGRVTEELRTSLIKAWTPKAKGGNEKHLRKPSFVTNPLQAFVSVVVPKELSTVSCAPRTWGQRNGKFFPKVA